MTKNCLVCGTTIIKKTKVSKKQWKAKKFCSIPCKSKWLGEKFRGNKNPVWIEIERKKICKGCGIVFMVDKPCEVKSRKFHSKECFYESRKGKYEPWNLGKFEYHPCKGCNKLIRKWQTFCSSKCYVKSRTGETIITKICEICKREFQITLQRQKKKYCSKKCSQKAIVQIMKGYWQNKDWREKQISLVLKSLIKRPTSLEQQMIDLIDKHTLPYKYVGDGSFIIGGKNPDFVNINGEKKLIEVGNTYHHIKRFGNMDNYIKERRKHFAQYGWESLFFMGDKLNSSRVIKLLRKGGLDWQHAS